MLFYKKKQRKTEKFYPKNSASIIFSPGFVKRGPIINISREGLTCLYFIDKTIREKYIDWCVNIICDNFTLCEIPFKIISDIKISGDRNSGKRIIRKRSIEFCNLDKAQGKKIDYFLNHYTKKSVSNYQKTSSTESFQLPLS